METVGAQSTELLSHAGRRTLVTGAGQRHGSASAARFVVESGSTLG